MSRRSSLWLAVLGVLALLALASSPAGRALAAHGSPCRDGRGWLTSAAPVLEAVLVGRAEAQEVLEFRRVPAESAAAEERRARRRGAAVPPVPAEAPEPPALPSPPERVSKTGNIMRIGSNVHVERDQVVQGDLLAVGGDVTVDGHVEGDVVAMGGDVRLNATARVDGDVASIGGELVEEPGAVIGGQRVTARGPAGARRHADRVRLREELDGFWSTARIASGLVWIFVLTAIAWAFASLAPGRTGAAESRVRSEPALSIGIGLLACALIVPSIVALALVVAILCITIIGIPLALAALFGYFVFLALLAVWGYAVAAVAVGDIVARRTRLGLAAATPGGPAPAPSLSRKAVLGVLVLSGSGVVGNFLQAMFFAPPLQGLGTFVSVVSKIATIVGATFGAGALLRNEAVAGTFRRWWGGRQGSRTPAPPPDASAASPATPPVPPPVPPAAPGEPPPGYAPPEPPPRQV